MSLWGDKSGVVTTAPYVAVGATLTTIAAGFVTIRLYHACTSGTRKLAVDDYMSVVELILLIAYFVLYTTLVFVDEEVFTVSLIEKAGFSLVFVSLPATFFAKAPILILYVRIFGVKTWFRIACKVTVAMMLAVYIVLLAVDWALYAQRGSPEDEVALVRFGNRTIDLGITSSAIAILNDVIIIILPLPIIAGLNLSFSKKVGLAAVFLTGTLALGSSIAALYYKAVSLSGDQSGQSIALLAASIECSIAIIVGCAPATRGLWNQAVASKALRSKAGSAIDSPAPKNNGRNEDVGDISQATDRNQWVGLSDGSSFEALV
ncbi:hypothetical protein F5Y16DRAFT_401873 [Xylariaceae sp. FL0255]|nr:hypothetical protein F5Y16DRAFT_401873 [Xylariaceae sp. FL0255]